MQIETLRKKDYKKVIHYAITGMHFDWYMKSKTALNAYGKYFLYSSLNRATQNIALYDGDTLAGVLLAEFGGEQPIQYSLGRKLYVKAFERLQKLLVGGAGEYDKANKKMLQRLRRRFKTDGELIFLTANPDIKGKGTGTVLLEELQRRAEGKRIFLFTDSACTYQFYEHRGFDRAEEEHVVLDLEIGEVPLDCFLYSRKL